RHWSRIDAHPLQTTAGGEDFVIAEAIGISAALDLARVGNDRGADMAGHHHRAFDMGSIEPQIVDQRFTESFDGELGGAVGSMRYAHSDRSPETVETAGVDDMALVGLH